MAPDCPRNRISIRYDAGAFLKRFDNPAPDVKPDDLPERWQEVYRAPLSANWRANSPNTTPYWTRSN